MNQYKSNHPCCRYKLIVIICVGFFISCGILDEDDDYFNGTMQAQVNDELIIFDEAYGDRALGDDMSWSGITKIIGKTDLKVSGYEIQIDFSFNPEKGKTYRPNCMYRTWIGNYYDNNLKAYLTKALNSENSEFSSTVTFTSVTNKSLEGTFSFTAYIVDENLKDSLIITDGKFEIASSGKKW